MSAVADGRIDTPGSALAQRTGVIPALDGIRALAVTMVFLSHGGLRGFIPGGLGVTVFFVLSGYLITTLMRVEYAARAPGTRGLAFGAFYLRRFLRLMPPLLVIVVLAGLLSSASLIAGGYSSGGLLAVLFYLGNYFVIAQDFNGLPAGIGVVWSLAVEEHYYLFYPPLALALLRIGRPAVSALTLGLLCLAVLGWRSYLALHGASEAYLSMATDTRIDAILIGCLLALVCNPWLDAVPRSHLWRDGLVAAGCIGVLLLTLLYRDAFFRVALRYSVQSLAIAPLLYLAISRSTEAPFRWLNARPLVYIGTISYSVYLSHQLILLFIARQWPHAGEGVTLLLAVALTLLVAESMRRWVELPCQRLRKRLHRNAALRASDEPQLQARTS